MLVIEHGFEVFGGIIGVSVSSSCVRWDFPVWLELDRPKYSRTSAPKPVCGDLSQMPTWMLGATEGILMGVSMS